MKYSQPPRIRNFLKLNWLFFIILAATSPAVVQAQEEQVELRFIAFPKATVSETVELKIGEGETLPVRLPYRSVSPPVQVPAMENWTLGKTVETEEGVPIFEVYGSAESTGTRKQLVLVIRNGPKNADGLSPVATDYSDAGLGGGDYFFMNATQVVIAGTLGDTKFWLNPDDHKIITPEVSKTKEGRGYCYMKAFYRNKEETQPFFSSTWRYHEEARSMVFFFHDTNTGQLRLHTTRSFVSDDG